jgi:putative component of membrane protein insertase Oxa1/YidC/SpoIIIJ protein YidD
VMKVCSRLPGSWSRLLVLGGLYDSVVSRAWASDIDYGKCFSAVLFDTCTFKVAYFISAQSNLNMYDATASRLRRVLKKHPLTYRNKHGIHQYGDMNVSSDSRSRLTPLFL